MKKIITTSILFISIAVAGCSSTPKEKMLLPDSGPTTAEIINGRRNAGQAYFGNEPRSAYVGAPISSGYAPNSSYSNSHVNELRRDFQRIPNPEIVGYIYPHIKENNIPVSGHYTVFKLYDKEHYGLSSEGHYGN